MKKKKVVFISASKYDALAQLNRIKEYKQKSDWPAVVVAVGYDAQRMCEKHGLPFKTTMDYLTTERHHRVFVEALRFAKEWYKNPEIEKTLTHRGISLSEMMDYHFYTIFSGLFLDIELYQGIFEIERPDKIEEGKIKNYADDKYSNYKYLYVSSVPS
jgi:hypothetical protein